MWVGNGPCYKAGFRFFSVRSIASEERGAIAFISPYLGLSRLYRTLHLAVSRRSASEASYRSRARHLHAHTYMHI